MVAYFGMVLVMAAAELSVDPALEARAKALEAKIIAPCCWTQPVSQHYSEVAATIKKQIREMLAAGRSDQEILDRYVSEYGERVLASPRPRGFNLLAYVLPWVGLGAGIALVWLILKRWSRGSQAVPSVAAPAPDADYDERIEKELRRLD